MPREFIRALGLIKSAAAQANADLGHLKKIQAKAIRHAAERVAKGEFELVFYVGQYFERLSVDIEKQFLTTVPVRFRMTEESMDSVRLQLEARRITAANGQVVSTDELPPATTI